MRVDLPHARKSRTLLPGSRLSVAVAPHRTWVRKDSLKRAKVRQFRQLQLRTARRSDNAKSATQGPHQFGSAPVWVHTSLDPHQFAPALLLKPSRHCSSTVCPVDVCPVDQRQPGFMNARSVSIGFAWRELSTARGPHQIDHAQDGNVQDGNREMNTRTPASLPAHLRERHHHDVRAFSGENETGSPKNASTRESRP